jgi:hypothetical protein
MSFHRGAQDSARRSPKGAWWPVVQPIYLRIGAERRSVLRQCIILLLVGTALDCRAKVGVVLVVQRLLL